MIHPMHHLHLHQQIKMLIRITPPMALITLTNRKTLAEMVESYPPRINRDINKTGLHTKNREESVGSQRVYKIKVDNQEAEVAEEEGGAHITAEVAEAEAETVGTATIVLNLRTGTCANQS